MIFLIQSQHLLKKFIELDALGIPPHPTLSPLGDFQKLELPTTKALGNYLCTYGTLSAVPNPAPQLLPHVLAAPGCSLLTLGTPQLQDLFIPPPSPSIHLLLHCRTCLHES